MLTCAILRYHVLCFIYNVISALTLRSYSTLNWSRYKLHDNSTLYHVCIKRFIIIIIANFQRRTNAKEGEQESEERKPRFFDCWFYVKLVEENSRKSKFYGYFGIP